MFEVKKKKKKATCRERIESFRQKAAYIFLLTENVFLHFNNQINNT